MEVKKTVSTAELLPSISALKIEMQKKGYSPQTLRGLENVWDTLLRYASTVPETLFDENFRGGFLQAEYGFRMDLEYTMYRASRALELLKNYIDFGIVTGIPKKQRQEFAEGYHSLITAFADGEARRGLAENSMKSLWSRLYRLHIFFLDKGADTFSMVTRDMINDFIKYLAPYSTTYVSENLRMLRRLCLYAYQNGHHAEDLSGCIPVVKNIRQQRLPAVFTEDETEKILSSFDRENPMGKRNYAIFLLAARMGLRSCDIKALEFSFINWTEKTISFAQKKTKKYLTLPLPDDVGWAIIDYLKNGRPISDSKYVFIQHKPPYGQYTDLRNVLVKQMRKAGIETPSDKRIGMHCFRHSLATAMLENGVPLPVISQTLGHADIASTEVYLRINISQLRLCALEVEL
ncbi:tyrosine-type recombinase/integrase [Clostridium perfringens]|mgnify:FL=1|jgi:integrase/recombinase XerD|uniref:tyrosine-type recombinase/integrase n=1 Tax=Clostridium perfringens TaxID=1502 RepID=UPI0024BC52C4|nr:tyrosine-type recombinase/integrase [Clostridium perfringens]